MPSHAVENRPLHPWEEDREAESLWLERAVREAVDQSIIVYRDPDSWYVFADGWRVRSVEEALEVTKEPSHGINQS